MLAVEELVKDIKDYNELKTSAERLKLVRLAIDILYDSASTANMVSDEKLREQYEASLTDPRRI